MKKIVYLILGVLLFIPTLVKADMSAPGIIGYKATPKSTSGADIYQYDSEREAYQKTGRKLEFGKIVTITWEDEFVSIDEDSDDEVKLSDLTPVDKEFKVNVKDLSDPYEILILEKQEIKKGPARAYEGTGKYLEAGTKVTVRYLEPDEEGNSRSAGDATAWVYVEYNGTKGFIDTEGKIAQNPVYTTVIASRDVEVTVHNTDTQIATIKANTKFDATIYELDLWSHGYYIEYNEIKGIVDDFEHFLPKRKPITFKPTRDISIYEDIEYNDDYENIAKVVSTAKKGTSFKSEFYAMYADVAILYYENGDVKGWIEESGQNVDEDDEDSDYLEVSTILGFTYPDDDSIVKVEKKVEEPTEETPVEKNPIEIIPQKDKEDPNKGLLSRIPTIAYYAIGALVIVIVTVIVTVALVKKKKNKEVDN